MDRIVCYRTSDGVIHENVLKAERHAEARYANALLPLSSKLVDIQKYKAMAEFIDSHLEDFVKLAAIKADIELSDQEND